MAQRLTNDELAERTRVANRRRGERMRQRLVDAGRCPLTVWVPTGLRSRFVNEAAAQGVNINELAERYLDAGLRDGNYNRERNLPDTDMNHGSNINRDLYLPDPDLETPDLFASPDQEPQPPVVVISEPATTPPPVSVSFGRTAMMTTIGELLDAGLTGNEIARRLNAAGYRSQNGAELRGANVLREYRTWKEKKGGSD